LQGSGLDVVTDKDGGTHLRVSEQAADVERAVEAITSASVNMRPYRG
jgi:hypothetical protein